MSTNPHPACPRCPGSPELEPTDLKGVAVNICKSCRSILMTRADLDAVVAMVGRKATRTPPADAAGYFDRVKDSAEFIDKTRSMACPNCRYNMYEVKSQGIVIDFCLSCQSIWFDEGELHSTLDKAREHGGISLVPDDLDGNDTAELICFMLETVTVDG